MNTVYVRILGLIMLVLIISGMVIYFTVDINTLTNLSVFQPWSVVMAILAIGVGLLLDGTRLMHMVKISGEHIRLKQAVEVVFGNYFLAMLGPGAAAGAAIGGPVGAAVGGLIGGIVGAFGGKKAAKKEETDTISKHLEDLY